MDVDDLHIGIAREVFTEFGDVNVHRASVEVVVVDPNLFERVVALENFVHMRAEQAEEFAFLGGELLRFAILCERLLLCIEEERTDGVLRAFTVTLATYTAQDSLNAEGQFFHRERLGEVVVGTDFEAFKHIFFECFSGQEHDGHLRVGHTNLFGKSETVFFGHHHVEDAEIVFATQKFAIAFFTIAAQHGVIALCLKIFAKEHTEVFIVLAKEDSHFSVRCHSCMGFIGE